MYKIRLNPSNPCRLEAPTFGIRVPLGIYPSHHVMHKYYLLT